MIDPKIQAKITSLQRLADHPNTPPHEAEAARGRIKALREKYRIVVPEPNEPNHYSTNVLQNLIDAMDRAAREARTDTNGRCKKPETFFNGGGHPRIRNKYSIDCARCGTRLAPGEGTIVRIAETWMGLCCEMTPGPRAKRF